jgi:peroxiredoxin
MADKAPIKEGDMAPDFTLLDENGQPITLSKFLAEGKNVVLYFYPKVQKKAREKRPLSATNERMYGLTF